MRRVQYRVCNPLVDHRLSRVLCPLQGLRGSRPLIQAAHLVVSLQVSRAVSQVRCRLLHHLVNRRQSRVKCRVESLALPQAPSLARNLVANLVVSRQRSHRVGLVVSPRRFRLVNPRRSLPRSLRDSQR